VASAVGVGGAEDPDLPRGGHEARRLVLVEAAGGDPEDLPARAVLEDDADLEVRRALGTERGGEETVPGVAVLPEGEELSEGGVRPGGVGRSLGARRGVGREEPPPGVEDRERVGAGREDGSLERGGGQGRLLESDGVVAGAAAALLHPAPPDAGRQARRGRGAARP
jgi:hypothetical protein